MAQAKLEHDPLFQLLTDALRAGPESPQWREAVQRVRESGADVDDFTLLCRARQRLQEGKEYRAVLPGPTFTRRVMSRIDEEASQARRGVPWASVIAISSLIVMLGAIVFVASLLLSSSSRPVAGSFEPTDAFSITIEYPPPRDTAVGAFIMTEASTAPFLSLEWEQNTLRLTDEKQALLMSQDIKADRVRLVIEPTIAKIEADGRVLWTGEHGLPTRGLRTVVESVAATGARPARFSTARLSDYQER